MKPGSSSQASFEDPTIDAMLREAASTSLTDEEPPFSGSARYELVRWLGEGGYGVVYEALDRERGDRVALKVLRCPWAGPLYRFKREFRALAGIRHPNLVQLYGLELAAGQAFLSMELVRGAPLLEHVGRDPERARQALRQLAEGVAALHRAGTLHRDVKPSNAIVEAGGRVVVLDFGLAISIDAHDAAELAGTPAYISPEQCAGAAATEASDWYAVGVVLYQALTGRAPLDGAVLVRKQLEDPPPPSAVAPGVPRDLDELCAALLAREPAARPTGAEVIARLGRAAAPRRARGSTPPPPFVGRGPEREALAAQLAAAAAGACTVTLARGPSGIGKSALLRRFLDDARRTCPATLILAGRCYEREAVPYKALDTVIDELAQHLQRLPAPEAEALLPPGAAALAQVFAVLRQVPAFERAARQGGGELAPLEQRARAIAALRELFARLAARGPVVVCIDDLQWGDADSAVLLAELVRGPDAPAVCWVAAFREDDAATSPLLARLAHLLEPRPRELALGPLEGGEARALATALLGDPARAAAVAAEAGGSPFFVHALASGEAGEAGGVAELVRRRAARLDGAARALLEAIVVAARPLEIGAAADAAGCGAQAREALGALYAARLVRSREGADEAWVEPYHDRIRDAVAAAIAPAPLRQLHLALAGALDRRGSADAARIARHLADGGDTARALDYTVRAARTATAALAFDEAVRLYRAALALRADLARPGAAAAGPPAAEDAALELAYGDALSTAGRGVEAAQVWLGALDRAPPTARLELQRRAAEELLLNGQLDAGYAVVDAVMRRLGLSAPRTKLGAIATIAAARLARAVRPGRLAPEAPSGTAEAAEARLAADTVSGLAWATWGVDPLMSAALQTRHVRLALRSGDRERAALALWLEAVVSAVGGTAARERTHRLVTEARSLAAPGAIAATVEGTIALFEGRWPQAEARLAEAARRPADTGGPQHGSLGATVRVMQLMCAYWRGRAGSVAREAPLLVREADERGNQFAWVWFGLLGAWAQACTGALDASAAAADAVRARLPAHRFELPRWYLVYGDVKRALAAGDPDEAWRRVGVARRTTRGVLTGQAQRIGAVWTCATAAITRAEARPDARRAMLGEAQRWIRRLEGERADWTAGLSLGLRAGVASVRGDADLAQRLLAEAEPRLDEHALELAAAAARRARGSLLGGAEGRALAARAEAWRASQGVSAAGLALHLPGRWAP